MPIGGLSQPGPAARCPNNGPARRNGRCPVIPAQAARIDAAHINKPRIGDPGQPNCLLPIPA